MKILTREQIMFDIKYTNGKSTELNKKYVDVKELIEYIVHFNSALCLRDLLKKLKEEQKNGRLWFNGTYNWNG